MNRDRKELEALVKALGDSEPEKPVYVAASMLAKAMQYQQNFISAEIRRGNLTGDKLFGRNWNVAIDSKLKAWLENKNRSVVSKSRKTKA